MPEEQESRSQYEQNIARHLPNAHEYLIWPPSVFLSVIKTIKTIAPRDCPVIVFGESGTGREVAARYIHTHSHRAKKLFIPINCAVLTGQLFETQVFGQVKGSSPTSTADTLGAFRAADGGTIFLDEIQQLAPVLQVKLLSVLQHSCVTPIGSAKSYPINIRVICATNNGLRQMVRKGTFQADLYFHINVAILQLPPLRENKEGIAILAKYFLDIQAQLHNEKPKQLTPSALKVLSEYSWPGNVRELANVVERVFVMSPSDKIGVSELPPEILAADILPRQQQKFPTMDEINKKLVIRALGAANGHKMAAARLLKIDHRKLSRLMAKYNLQLSDNKTL